MMFSLRYHFLLLLDNEKEQWLYNHLHVTMLWLYLLGFEQKWGTKSFRKATELREFDVIEAENKSSSPRYEIKLFSTSQNQIINFVTSSAAITVNYATNKAFLLAMYEMKRCQQQNARVDGQRKLFFSLGSSSAIINWTRSSSTRDQSKSNDQLWVSQSNYIHCQSSINLPFSPWVGEPFPCHPLFDVEFMKDVDWQWRM